MFGSLQRLGFLVSDFLWNSTIAISITTNYPSSHSRVLDGRYRLIRNRFGTDRNEESIWQDGNELKRVEPTEESTEKVMDVGQKVVFVRAVKGAEVGKHGTVMKVADDMVVVDCTLQEHLVPVLAEMWDVLPERLWERLLSVAALAQGPQPPSIRLGLNAEPKHKFVPLKRLFTTPYRNNSRGESWPINRCAVADHCVCRSVADSLKLRIPPLKIGAVCGFLAVRNSYIALRSPGEERSFAW
jgi:hypothetical protein